MKSLKLVKFHVDSKNNGFTFEQVVYHTYFSIALYISFFLSKLRDEKFINTYWSVFCKFHSLNFNYF